MDTRHLVTLPKDVMDRCVAHGELVVASYFAGLNVNSRSVSSHGADLDPELQAHAKMCECAFALWADLDPFKVLNWSNRPDVGYDIEYMARIDVKGIRLGRKYLIWPIKKNRLYDRKKFDVLVLVRGDGPQFEIVRWIGKDEFKQKHEVASPGHPLDNGTWFMHEKQLRSMDDFCPIRMTA